MSVTVAEPEAETLQDTRPPPPPMMRHLVAIKPNGEHEDTALCGKPWDRINVTWNGTLCEECVKELKKRHG